MPDYRYTARGMSGGPVSGVLSAGSEQEVISSLATKQLFPIEIRLSEEEVARRATPGGGRVKAGQIAILFSQLADLLKSGVPMLRSLELLERQATNPRLKGVIQGVREDVADGTPLFEAMRKHPRAFNELSVSMVRAGEEGSFLEDVLKRYAAFTEHQEEIKSKVTGAMAYPVFLTTVGVLVVSVMLVYFVPKFEPLFEGLKERDELPWATSSLLLLSTIVKDYWIVAGLVVGVGAYLLSNYIGSEDGRARLDRLRLRMPGMGPIVRSLAISRFCRVLGTLLRNGVPILNSLRISKDATANKVLSAAIGVAAENIQSGKSLAKPLGASGEFPEEIVEMIAVGEEANNLENVLIDIADNLERHTQRKLDLFVRLVEPLLLLVMAGAVLYLVVALLLPVMKSSGAL